MAMGKAKTGVYHCRDCGQPFPQAGAVARHKRDGDCVKLNPTPAAGQGMTMNQLINNVTALRSQMTKQIEREAKQADTLRQKAAEHDANIRRLQEALQQIPALTAAA